jgi:thiol:disulfide interchange protein DsbG
MERMGIKHILFLLVMAGLLGAAPAAFAQAQSNNPVFTELKKAGGSVEFIGNAYGMDGWIVKDPKGDVKTTLYTTPEGAVIAGMLFAPDGTSETQKQMEAYKKRIDGASQEPAPGAEKSSARSEKFYAEAEKAGWVALGDNQAPYLYVFMNVNCDHCQAFWKDLESFVDGGKMQVRLIPFGKEPANRDGGAALLSVDNPEAAWKAYAGGDKTALSKDKIKGDAYAKIDANTAMANTWKLAEVPFTLYRRPGDGTLSVILGRPDNPLLLLAEFIK